MSGISITVKELRNKAKKMGIKGYSKMNKEELMANEAIIKSFVVDFVVDKVQELLGNGYTIEAKEIAKNNEVVTGIIIHNANSNIAPTIYINEMLEKGNNIQAISEAIVLRYKEIENQGMPAIDVNNIANFEWVKPRLTLKLITAKGNEEVYKGVVCEPFFDLMAIVYIKLTEDASCRVTEQLLKNWNCAYADVINIAKANIENSEPEFVNLGALMGAPEIEIPGMCVITNKERLCGANMMFSPKAMEMACKKLDTDTVIVLPSSVHEVIAIPYELEAVKGCNAMVQEVNETQVEPEDRLADHVFIYSITEGWRM